MKLHVGHVHYMGGERQELSAGELGALITQLVETIMAACGPRDSALAAMGVTKVIGEILRIECGQDIATEMLQEAVERVRALRLEAAPDSSGDDDDDPFTIPN